MRSAFIPRARHLPSRQAEHPPRVCWLIIQLPSNWHTNVFYSNWTSNYAGGERDTSKERKPTDRRRALRRKKALHDIHVMTSKFMPRALSPHTRQIRLVGIARLPKTFLSSIWKKDWMETSIALLSQDDWMLPFSLDVCVRALVSFSSLRFARDYFHFASRVRYDADSLLSSPLFLFCCYSSVWYTP